jgi:hypothetical protein
VVEDFFEAIVDEIDASSLRLRTVSSTGEEGLAWLPIEKIPKGERVFIELGAPLRVSVVVHSGTTTNERKTEIRFLRPLQWRPKADTSALTDRMMDRMKAILGGG